MEPENEPLEKETPFFEILNLGFHVEFRGCNKWLMVGRLTGLPFCVGKATKVKQDTRKITNRSETIQNLGLWYWNKKSPFLRLSLTSHGVDSSKGGKPAVYQANQMKGYREHISSKNNSLLVDGFEDVFNPMGNDLIWLIVLGLKPQCYPHISSSTDPQDLSPAMACLPNWRTHHVPLCATSGAFKRLRRIVRHIVEIVKNMYAKYETYIRNHSNMIICNYFIYSACMDVISVGRRRVSFWGVSKSSCFMSWFPTTSQVSSEG